MSVAETIKQKLEAAFPVKRLEIVDDSDKHKGHSGANPNGETHFSVHIVSPAFDGVSRIDRQRQVMSVLEAELAGPVHALVIKAQTPDQAG